MQNHGKVVTLDAKPIQRFEAWMVPDDSQQASLWPGVMELTPTFYQTLTEHAVPLDHRALAALKHSSLALDVYTWLAHRLCRIRSDKGVHLSWQNLRDQFGEEYNDPKNFKRKFLEALRQVHVVYPAANVHEIAGGIRLEQSRPPLAPTSVSMYPSRPPVA
jgi:hypothetical protein